ncbi:hypothetical protein IT570_09110 [Candidatus Sumerlaeota bacterium]|nr:hypothetical protein [Candidatus Sumerlaeota bacterium]
MFTIFTPTGWRVIARVPDKVRRVCFIVPEFPPRSGGVGDHARLICDELAQSGRYQIEVACTRTKPEDVDGESAYPIHWLGFGGEGKLPAYLAGYSGDLVLHYSGYGYQKRSCPLWLLKALRCWKGKAASNRLFTMFHELGGTGPIHSSSFWLGPVQWWIPKAIARISSDCLTNREEYARYLSSACDRAVSSLPVFSNVGEPRTMPSSRLARLVVFGSSIWRERAFRDDATALAHTCDVLKLSEVVNIGASSPNIPDRVGTIPVRCTGWLQSGELSAFLSESAAGFFSYPVNFLGKSTIFSAYCAHGIVPVGSAPNIEPGEGLRHRAHYLLSHEMHEPPALEEISTNVSAWYRGHCLERHVARYHEMLSVG